MPDVYTRVTEAPRPIPNALVASGRADAREAAELKAEARRRIAAGEHFGHIAYLSVVARKPR